jgi:hypothetical protein
MANLSIRWPKNKRFAAMVETIEFEWQSFFRRVGERVSALEAYTVATLPSAADNPRMTIYVSDEVGGAVPAFSDGVNWRRMTDRNVVA